MIRTALAMLLAALTLSAPPLAQAQEGRGPGEGTLPAGTLAVPSR